MEELSAADRREYRRFESEAIAKWAKRNAEMQALRDKDCPPHPGRILRDKFLQVGAVPWLPHHGIGKLAEQLGLARITVSRVVNGRARITTEFALRLAVAFGEDAQWWLDAQTRHDLWQAGHRRAELEATLWKKQLFWTR